MSKRDNEYRKREMVIEEAARGRCDKDEDDRIVCSVIER